MRLKKQAMVATCVAAAILASACSPNQQAANDASAAASTEQFASSAETMQPDQRLLESARSRVRDMTFSVMLTQERELEDAYSKGSADELSSKSNLLMQGAPDAAQWKGSEFDPYLKCDTAWRDLGLYASAMAKDLKYGGDTHRKILDQERADYIRTKKSCQDFLDMSVEAAWKADEARFSK